MCCSAYANNQHKLDQEIGDGDQPLSETSFFRAMKLARGTVSVVDANGMSWTRIWCGGLMANYSLCRMNHTATMA